MVEIRVVSPKMAILVNILMIMFQNVDDEMSGEFGDNVSISSRRKSIVVTEEEIVRIIIIIFKI